MTAKMCCRESESLEDNEEKKCKSLNSKSNGYCLSKSNGLHCSSGKIISKDKTDFCALTLLDLSNSELNSIPIEINDLKNLLILNISNNHLDKINANLSNNLLSKLIASFNRLPITESLISRITESFPSLTDLNLSFQSNAANNQLRVNLDDCHPECTQLELNKCQLKYINLSGNRLTQLNRINGCPTLHTVILHSNRMTTIPLFKSCQQLQVLDISNNCFDEQLLTGNNLDILFNNCPSLKHLDMTGSGGFNARNVINRSQYLTVPVSERLIHFVDIGCVRSHSQIAISNSFINSAVCVQALTETELVIGLVNGTKYAPIIKTNFSAILETELSCVETKDNFLKNSILSMYRLLSDRKCENLRSVNIILAHLKSEPSGIAVKVASCGQWTSLRHVPLTANHNLNNSSPKIINLSSAANAKSLSKKCLPEDNGFIADPICHELTLSAADDQWSHALLMGITDIGEDESVCEQYFTSGGDQSLTDKLKRYTEVINSKNNYLNSCDSCDNHCFGANFLALAIHPKLIDDNSRCEEESSLKSSSSCNTSETTNESAIDSEHSEKYRSWEYILEQNHKCLFTKELEALQDMDAKKFDSICSRKVKSSHTPIISLQQFITRSDKLKSYDSNTFKVYKI